MTRTYGERLAAWAARLDARAADVRYPRPEAGGEVCAVRLTPRDAPRARVLVAHGAGNDAVYPLLELFRALLRAGAEVFAFDLDGHGCASTTVFAPGTVRTAVAAAAAAAERGRPPLPLHLPAEGGLALLQHGAGMPGQRSVVAVDRPVARHAEVRVQRSARGDQEVGAVAGGEDHGVPLVGLTECLAVVAEEPPVVLVQCELEVARRVRQVEAAHRALRMCEACNLGEVERLRFAPKAEAEFETYFVQRSLQRARWGCASTSTG